MLNSQQGSFSNRSFGISLGYSQLQSPPSSLRRMAATFTTNTVKKGLRRVCHTSWASGKMYIFLFCLTIDYLQLSTEYYHYGHKNSGESRRRRRRREWDEGIDVFDSNWYEYRRCRETMHETQRKKAQETLQGFGMVFSPFFHLFPYYLHLFRY